MINTFIHFNFVQLMYHKYSLRMLYSLDYTHYLQSQTFHFIATLYYLASFKYDGILII